MSSSPTPAHSDTPEAPQPSSPSFVRRHWPAVVAVVKKYFAVPLLAALIGALIIGRIVGTISGPPAYRVYVVGCLSDPQSAVIVKAFGASMPKLNGTPVEVYPVDDLGEPDTAERVSQQLVARNDTLMVVGHMYSTQTQRALPAYMQAADPPVPVILTTETNPDIVPSKATSLHYNPVLRLSATDVTQADTAAKFIASRGGQRIWVVEDRLNPVYSKFLARRLVEDVHGMKPGPEVVLWSTNYTIPPAYAVNTMKIDWVFFAGDWHDGLVLIHQLRAMNLASSVKVLLTDWAVGESLLLLDDSDLEIYVTHPVPPATFSSKGYAVFGEDAHAVVSQLLQETDENFADFAGREGGLGYDLRRLLGIRRVGDARRALAQAMQLQRRPFALSSGSTSFDVNGLRANATFYVWRIRNHQFTTPD